MEHPAANRTGVAKFVIFAALLALGWYLGRVAKIDVQVISDRLSGLPLAVSGVIFVLLYVGTTTFVWFGPKDVLRIASAILFGATVSTVFVWIGEMVNALVMFHLSRLLGREYVQERFHTKTKDLDRMNDDSSTLGVIAWRINPLVPFRLLDLGYGLTRIPFKRYLAAISGVSALRIYWLQYILAGIGANLFKDMSSLIDYLTAHPRIIGASTLYFGAVIVLTLSALIARRARKKRVMAGGTAQ